MTPADPFFAKPPEMTVLGPLGSFRLFGTPGNDFGTANKYYSWSDTLSWVHGKQTLRFGAFFLTQANWREDAGTARGRLYFQTFNDFLIGLSAADNLSPLGRSNIQTIQASEGVGPAGEVQYHYRSYYAAPFIQDDLKVNSRLTLNLGLRWEYVGPALDTTGAIGNAWPSLLQQMPVPPATGTYIGNTVAANYNPNLINPYTGQAFGALPTGVFVRSTKSFYQNSTPLDTFAPRFRTGLAALRLRPARGARRLWLVLSDSHLQRQRLRHSAVHLRAVCARLQQLGLQQQSLQPAETVPHDYTRLRPAHSDVATFRSRRRTGVPDPQAPAVEPERAGATVPDAFARCRLRGFVWRPSADLARSQSAAAGERRAIRSTASPPTRRSTPICACRFPARLRLRSRRTSSSARRLITACRLRCAARFGTACRSRPTILTRARPIIRRSTTT